MPFPTEEAVFTAVLVIGTFQTGDNDEPRITIQGGAGGPEINLWTDDPDEEASGIVSAFILGAGATRNAVLTLNAPDLVGTSRPRIRIIGPSFDGVSEPSLIDLDAETIHMPSSTATGPTGLIVRKVALHSAAGTLLGYIPVYNSIT